MNLRLNLYLLMLKTLYTVIHFNQCSEDFCMFVGLLDCLLGRLLSAHPCLAASHGFCSASASCAAVSRAFDLAKHGLPRMPVPCRHGQRLATCYSRVVSQWSVSQLMRDSCTRTLHLQDSVPGIITHVHQSTRGQASASFFKAGKLATAQRTSYNPGMLQYQVSQRVAASKQ